MDLQIKPPRSAGPRLLFLAAVILAVALWPLLQQVMDIVSPDLDLNLKTGSSSWDLAAPPVHGISGGVRPPGGWRGNGAVVRKIYWRSRYRGRSARTILRGR